MRKIALAPELIPAYHLIKWPAAARVWLVTPAGVPERQHENRQIFGWVDELVGCQYLCRLIDGKSLNRTRVNPPLRCHQHGKAEGDIRLVR